MNKGCCITCLWCAKTTFCVIEQSYLVRQIFLLTSLLRRCD
nr:MAG TPA: hypothetical protein [Caudoviricetes sp.]